MIKIKLSPIKESFAHFHKNKSNTKKELENPFNKLFKKFFSITDNCESFQKFYDGKIAALEKIMESKFSSVDHHKLNYILRYYIKFKKKYISF